VVGRGVVVGVVGVEVEVGGKAFGKVEVVVSRY
jgi:hypothetical protein